MSFKITYDGPSFRIREKGTAPSLIDWKCAAGHKKWDTYPDGAARPDAPMCDCGLAMSEVIGFPSIDSDTMNSGTYPKFNHGLGVRVESRAHEKQIEEARGLVRIVDVGEVDRDQIERDAAVKAREEDAVVRTMLESCDADPAMRKARDDGLVESWEPWKAALGMK